MLDEKILSFEDAQMHRQGWLCAHTGAFAHIHQFFCLFALKTQKYFFYVDLLHRFCTIPAGLKYTSGFFSYIHAKVLN